MVPEQECQWDETGRLEERWLVLWRADGGDALGENGEDHGDGEGEEDCAREPEEFTEQSHQRHLLPLVMVLIRVDSTVVRGLSRLAMACEQKEECE